MRGSCKADLAASADLYSLLPPNIPGDGAPSAPSTALDSAWKDIRFVHLQIKSVYHKVF